MTHTLDVASSVVGTLLRGTRGGGVTGRARKQPERPLELYEFEASPYCRLVREVITELDLDVMVYPCPQGGERFRSVVKKLGGKQQYPFMVDPNTGTSLYESADIIRYLGETYEGRPKNPKGLRRNMAIGMGVSVVLARGIKGLRGYKVRPSKAPAKPLELYSFEASPYSRLVREVLCELEIPYLLRSTGKGRFQDIGPAFVRDKWFKTPKGTTRNRKALEARTGHVQVPYLIDPNTGTEMYESADIIAYLKKTYGA